MLEARSREMLAQLERMKGEPAPTQAVAAADKTPAPAVQ
jgi:hypothetical protein